MAQACGHASLDALVAAAVPALIRRNDPMSLPQPLGETAALGRLRSIAAKNQVYKSYIGPHEGNLQEGSRSSHESEAVEGTMGHGTRLFVSRWQSETRYRS
jgi:hypothetical protein